MYQTLEEIDARKTELQKAIDAKKTEISDKWNDLFHPVEESPLIQSPTQRFISMAQKSAGLIDGALLGWKLYRKFSGGKRRR